MDNVHFLSACLYNRTRFLLIECFGWKNITRTNLILFLIILEKIQTKRYKEHNSSSFFADGIKIDHKGRTVVFPNIHAFICKNPFGVNSERIDKPLVWTNEVE